MSSGGVILLTAAPARKVLLESGPLSEELLALAGKGLAFIVNRNNRKHRIRNFDLFMIIALFKSIFL
jgi:hypothetical protein